MAAGRRPRSITAATLGAALLVAVTALAAKPAATSSSALFNDVEAATAVLDADILEPPSGLGVVGGATAALTWTPSGDAYASGYAVERATSSGGTYALVGTATPVTAIGLVDIPATDGTYWYRVKTYVASWESGVAGPVSADVLMGVTGFHACATQAADAGGDGDGYEGNPADGCVVDGALATDTNSGTGTGTLCNGSGKDKHRFSDFGLGVPASATAILGIEVRVTVGINTIFGTNLVCARLSWNGGSNWTPASSVTLTATAPTGYSLGGPSFLWGRAWTPAQLSDANFRVRISDVSNSTARDYSLDGVEVQVTYTP
ncbi:MAG: hypothetical protein AB1736_06720 [Chloroflexota bacterium]